MSFRSRQSPIRAGPIRGISAHPFLTLAWACRNKLRPHGKAGYAVNRICNWCGAAHISSLRILAPTPAFHRRQLKRAMFQESRRSGPAPWPFKSPSVKPNSFMAFNARSSPRPHELDEYDMGIELWISFCGDGRSSVQISVLLGRMERGGDLHPIFDPAAS